jgi:hypothetical protein
MTSQGSPGWITRPQCWRQRQVVDMARIGRPQQTGTAPV